jgi:hypothetical protein
VEAGVDVKKSIKQDQPNQTLPALARYLIANEWRGKGECPQMSRFSHKDVCVGFA